MISNFKKEFQAEFWLDLSRQQFLILCSALIPTTEERRPAAMVLLRAVLAYLGEQKICSTDLIKTLRLSHLSDIYIEESKRGQGRHSPTTSGIMSYIELGSPGLDTDSLRTSSRGDAFSANRLSHEGAALTAHHLLTSIILTYVIIPMELLEKDENTMNLLVGNPPTPLRVMLREAQERKEMLNPAEVRSLHDALENALVFARS